jgi:preprotein translocase subunit YajC
MIAVFFYFMIIRASSREKQQRQAMISALKKDDEVITSAGIIGKIAMIKDKEDEVALKVDDAGSVRLRVLKSSIVRVLPKKEPAKESPS